MSTWTLATARTFISKLQRPCMESGYYIALAGGVLNRGHSNNDLDLVAVPRHPEATLQGLYSVLKGVKGLEFKAYSGNNVSGYYAALSYLKMLSIDLIVIARAPVDCRVNDDGRSIKAKSPELQPWDYMGISVVPADRNDMGIKWSTSLVSGTKLRADTKDEMRRLIRGVVKR